MNLSFLSVVFLFLKRNLFALMWAGLLLFFLFYFL